ncbi:MAG: hypothetical protein ABI577_03720 [bacterium]
MTSTPSPAHPDHEWVVDLVSGRVRQRQCPACIVLTSLPAPAAALHEDLEIVA